MNDLLKHFEWKWEDFTQKDCLWNFFIHIGFRQFILIGKIVSLVDIDTFNLSDNDFLRSHEHDVGSRLEPHCF